MGLVSCPSPLLLRHWPFSPSHCAPALEGFCLALCHVDGIILGPAVRWPGVWVQDVPTSWSSSSRADPTVDLGLQGRNFSVIMAPSPWLPSCVCDTPPPLASL